MKYFFMIISILFSVINACVLKKYSHSNKENFNPFLFNSGVSIVWIIIMLIILAFSDNHFSMGAMIYGAVYGVILFAFLYLKTQSMATGPVSLSTLIGSCAFVIATAFGVIYSNDTVSIISLFGMLMLFASLFMCVNPKKSEERLTGKWFLYCFGFFFAGGIVGILYRLYGASDYSSDMEVMLLTSAVVSEIMFMITGIAVGKKSGNIKPNRTAVMYMIVSGIASCLYIRMNLSLSNMISSVIFFPVSNGGMVILSTVMGRIMFKEKLTIKQLCGIALGCIAVLVIGCGDFFYSMIS